MMIPSWSAWRTMSRVDPVCAGYSGLHHWKFFKDLFADPAIRDICILGVYRGRDLAYIASILKGYKRSSYNLVGVDKFADSYGADWPSEMRELNWEQAGYGKPPDMNVAMENLRKLNLDEHIRLHQATAQQFLVSGSEKFDFIYIDISHDYPTTLEVIDLAIPRLKAGGLIGGDDFSDQATWGVASAVRDSFSKYEVFANWIWTAQIKDYKKNRTEKAG